MIKDPVMMLMVLFIVVGGVSIVNSLYKKYRKKRTEHHVSDHHFQ
jgi:hypothetical protein